jgi:hypothetical protein
MRKNKQSIRQGRDFLPCLEKECEGEKDENRIKHNRERKAGNRAAVAGIISRYRAGHWAGLAK